MSRSRELAGRRISLILHTFDRGGSGRVAAYLAQGFAKLGMTVDLIVFARGGEVEGVATDLAGPDVEIRYLGELSGKRPVDLMRGLPKLTRILRREKPDVVVVCANNTALVSAFAYRRAGLSNSRLFLKTTNPIATSRHKGMARRIRLLSYRLIFPWADAVWTLSQEESAEMREAFPTFQGLFRSVDNPYVTPAMFALPAASAVDAPFKTVIAVARLTAQKRLDRLILAFAQIDRPGVRLLILGEGEDRQKLEDMIEELGIGDRVSMPGYVDDVAAALHAADLFVLSSDYEGLPAVVLEAMAANCPVLGTDCFPAARALLGSTDGCGIIGRTDPEGLSALIETFLARPRPTHLRAIAERYSIANGIASHAEAVRSTF